MFVFDGDCGFCSRYAAWIAARLPSDVEVVAWQQLGDLSSFGLTQADVDCAAWWIDDEGRAGGGDAIARSLVAAGGPWRFVGGTLRLRAVRPLTGAVYRRVAAHRHRLPGATDACRLDGDPS